MRRPDARWIHAAKVALAATAVVGVVALVLVLGGQHPHRAESHPRHRQPARRHAGGRGLRRAGVGRPDDRASRRRHRRRPRLRVAGGCRRPGDGADRRCARRCPTHAWGPGAVTLPTGGTNFRFGAVPSDGGWLVAGESVIRAHDVRGELLAVEVVLGVLLLGVTFIGSFIVGLRASAPIEQIRRRQAEFTADASHELRTPLSVIEAEVELSLGRARGPDEYRATLERIGSESQRLRAIVDDLLWLARADGRALDRSQADYVDVADGGGHRGRPLPGGGRHRLVHPDHRHPAIRHGAGAGRRGGHRPAGHRPRGQRLQVRGVRRGRRGRGVGRGRTGGADGGRLGAGHSRRRPGPGLRPLPPGRPDARAERASGWPSPMPWCGPPRAPGRCPTRPWVVPASRSSGARPPGCRRRHRCLRYRPIRSSTRR